MRFVFFGVDLYAFNRAHHYALRLIEVTDAFGALRWVDFVYVLAHVNGLVRALGLAHIAIDAFVGDVQCHSCCARLRGLALLLLFELRCGLGSLAMGRSFGVQPALDRREHKLADIAA